MNASLRLELTLNIGELIATDDPAAWLQRPLGFQNSFLLLLGLNFGLLLGLRLLKSPSVFRLLPGVSQSLVPGNAQATLHKPEILWRNDTELELGIRLHKGHLAHVRHERIP